MMMILSFRELKGRRARTCSMMSSSPFLRQGCTVHRQKTELENLRGSSLRWRYKPRVNSNHPVSRTLLNTGCVLLDSVKEISAKVGLCLTSTMDTSLNMSAQPTGPPSAFIDNTWLPEPGFPGDVTSCHPLLPASILNQAHPTEPSSAFIDDTWLTEPGYAGDVTASHPLLPASILNQAQQTAACCCPP